MAFPISFLRFPEWPLSLSLSPSLSPLVSPSPFPISRYLEELRVLDIGVVRLHEEGLVKEGIRWLDEGARVREHPELNFFSNGLYFYRSKIRKSRPLRPLLNRN